MKKFLLLVSLLLFALSGCKNENEIIQPSDKQSVKQSNASLGPKVSSAATNAGGQL
jgi:uncharacterized protein YcfL